MAISFSLRTIHNKGHLTEEANRVHESAAYSHKVEFDRSRFADQFTPIWHAFQDFAVNTGTMPSQ